VLVSCYWFYLGVRANPFAVGLIIWGISIDQMYHWIVGQIAFFLCEVFRTPKPEKLKLTFLTVAAGIQMGNTVITSYIVDCYPLQSMSVITFYSVFLNLSAFINPVGSPALPH